MKIKDNYNTEKTEQRLVKYWKDEAKNGNKNATQVLNFRDYLIERESRIVGMTRRVIFLGRLKYNQEFFDKPYHETDEKGMLKAMNRLENSTLKNGKPKSPYTIQTAKVTLRKFYAWLEYGDDMIERKRVDGYPRRVKLIDMNLTREEKFRVRKSEDDILTKDEVRRLIEFAPRTSDKALISFMYETGCRVGELCNLTLKDIKFTNRKGEVKVTLFGKTGHRDNLIKYYSKYFIPHLNSHPYKNDKDRAVFLTQKGEDITPSCVNAIIKRVATYSGLSTYKYQSYISGKRVYPHIFRHTSATHKLRDGWTESIVKQWFGWSRTSTMVGVYGHLSSNDAMDFVRNKFSDEEKVEQYLECNKSSCHAVNETTDLSCWYCREPLAQAKENSMVELGAVEEMENKLLAMFKLYADSMNSNETVKIAHNKQPEMLREIFQTIQAKH